MPLSAFWWQCRPKGPYTLQVDIIASQGILELFILVAALRLHRRGYQAVNFELLWAEYAKTRGNAARGHLQQACCSESLPALAGCLPAGVLWAQVTPVL